MTDDVLVAKIGGSTLGSHDTTLTDLAELQHRGVRSVVVHGGGSLINEWLTRHNIHTRFENGLRVTDEESLNVVVAVLAGLINKRIVASLTKLGARAVGMSGVDAGMIRAKLRDEKLGFVGDVTEVDSRVLEGITMTGVIPVIAPIGLLWEGDRATDQLLNINADSMAGAIAAALKARWLVFLTDVPGIRGEGGDSLSRVSSEEAKSLIDSGVIQGGMIPKVEACLSAVRAGCRGVIVDGRSEGALASVVRGEFAGTVLGEE
ncbi:MAG: acetylglutamate kinase [Chloroflexi bacterium]|nr:acetylglutamate kinase [Chloroflexota bacterium]